MRDPYSRLFAELLPQEFVEIRLISKGSKVEQGFFKTPEEAQGMLTKGDGETNVYFGVAPRSTKSGTAESVQRLLCLWADLDTKDENAKVGTLIARVRKVPLPPTYIVNTGGGVHLYWWLTTPLVFDKGSLERARTAMAAIAKELGGDAVHDPARILRVPGTKNVKYDPCRDCETVYANPQLTYSLEDLTALPHVMKFRGMDRVQTGDSVGFKSRSELDWIVVRGLLQGGISEQAVVNLFELLPIGKKFHQPAPAGGEAYLNRTIEKARESLEKQKERDTGKSKKKLQANDIEIRENSYWVGEVQLSSFCLEPKVIVTIDGNADDVIICDVKAQGTDYVWRDIVFPRRAFDDKRSLQKQALSKAGWMWYAGDREPQLILSKIMDELRERGLPLKVMTQTLGVTKDPSNNTLWIGTSQTLTIDATYEDDTAPVSYLAPKHEAPIVRYTFPPEEQYKEFLTRLYDTLPQINRPGVTGCLIGWVMATPFKMGLEEIGVRFPICSVYGTRGSGKTTILQKVGLPILGVINPKGYSCATTQFVLLALFGSTNSIPIAFHEFRRNTFSDPELARFTRLLLQAYNVGTDYRGRSDQSTRAYPLLAPVMIDGEDMLNDPALRERIVPILMHPADVAPGTKYFQAFKKLSDMPLQDFAGRYIQYCLTRPITKKEWEEVLQGVDKMAPNVQSDRIRNNLGVVAFGLKVFEEFGNKWGVKVPKLVISAISSAADPKEGNGHNPELDVSLTDRSMSQIVAELLFEAAGRTPLMVDSFVTDIVNQIDAHSETRAGFNYRYEHTSNTLWFHLTSAVQWWNQARARRREVAVDVATVRAQLNELEVDSGGYIIEARIMNVESKAVRMYGVDVSKAHDAGLDIPDRLTLKIFTIRV